MKLLSIVVLTCVTTTYVVSQDNPYKNIVNEITVSLNKTILNSEGEIGKVGTGIGVYHVFNDSGWIQPTVGLEYNYTSQFNAHMIENHFSYSSDMTYHLHYFSMPLVCRFSFGKKYKLFIDPGIFLDNDIRASRRKGYLYDPFEVVLKKVNQSVSLNRIFGLQGGVGFCFPTGKQNLIVKYDVKLPLGDSAEYRESLWNFYWRVSVGIHF